MAKKVTDRQNTVNQDSIREERIYQSEKNRIEMNENSSKRRTRRKIIDGIGMIVTGRGKEGVRVLRRAVRERSEDQVRNSVEGIANDAIHNASKKQQRVRTQIPGEQPGMQQPGIVNRSTGMEYQTDTNTDIARAIPPSREGSNGLTVDQLTELNKLKNTDPKKYKEEMQRLFGMGKVPGQKQEMNIVNNEKHGLKL